MSRIFLSHGLNTDETRKNAENTSNRQLVFFIGERRGVSATWFDLCAADAKTTPR
jgi:hypothetical protein